jgi:hypothetical protein
MIRKKQPVQEIVIDLTGPQGNVFYLMAWVSKNWRIAIEPEDEVADLMDGLFEDVGRSDLKRPPLCERIIQEMKMGDYEDAIRVFDNYFGHIVILER